jgi:DNA-binding NarL/FixJ family response regulator
MSHLIRSIIVDSVQLFRECLATALANNENIKVVDTASDTKEALAKVKIHRPDVALVGLDHSSHGALDLTNQISLEFPHTRVVILGATESEETAMDFIRAGAKAYIAKDSSLDEVIKAVQAIHRGGAVCSPQVAYSVFTRVAELSQMNSDKISAVDLSLTPRESEILQLIADGLHNRQIADQLFLSLFTVKNHVHNILEKLQVGRRKDAVQYACGKGLVKCRNHIKEQRAGVGIQILFALIGSTDLLSLL